MTTENTTNADEGRLDQPVRPYATSVTWRNDQGGSWQQWHDDGDPMPTEWDDRPPDDVVHVYTEAQVAEMLAAERAESARLRHLLNLARDDYNTAAQRLQDIGDYAHDHSTGPAVPDALWEVRSMAYGS